MVNLVEGFCIVNVYAIDIVALDKVGENKIGMREQFWVAQLLW